MLRPRQRRMGQEGLHQRVSRKSSQAQTPGGTPSRLAQRSRAHGDPEAGAADTKEADRAQAESCRAGLSEKGLARRSRKFEKATSRSAVRIEMSVLPVTRPCRATVVHNSTGQVKSDH